MLPDFFAFLLDLLNGSAIGLYLNIMKTGYRIIYILATITVMKGNHE